MARLEPGSVTARNRWALPKISLPLDILLPKSPKYPTFRRQNRTPTPKVRGGQNKQ